MKPKHRITIEKSSGEILYEAEVFWKRLFYKNEIKTHAFQSSFDGDPFNYQQFIIKLINNEPCSLNSSGYESLVKHQLCWSKIATCFSGLKIDKEEVDFIVFLLKPYPFTNEFKYGYPELELLVQSTCAEINKLRKKLSPLAIQFNNIRFPHHDILPIVGFDHIQCNYYLSLCRKIVQIGKKIPGMHFRYLGIEKSRYKFPQKHTFWKYAVTGAVHRLNKYCHDDNCERECNVIHRQTIRVIARLLKILYPSIWREKLDTITKRIKTKYYTFTPP